MMKTVRLNTPTLLTVIRMILSLIFLMFVLIPAGWSRAIALIFFLIAASTDKIDGYLARKNHETTDLGAFLDPLADKMLVNLALLALTYLNIVPVWVFAIILVRDFAVDGLRMTLAKKHKTLPAFPIGKLKTTTQIIAIAILLFNLLLNNGFVAVIGNIFLYLSLFLTVLSGAYYFKSYSKYLKSDSK